ncbi:hypothetical protein QW71_24935 [Paenibacillus sp. IHB B 3415]|uniref:hypothetical protein n=1 Tax=Paenibacillus sp. IHB B 3415 TaxID=867080 RepID=UPI0005733B1C|nr:hypothetical protein [Paenibacillus sp. IHB B 3415]KHL93213.1 hypothetical protein QW71_24935 [Paenibacillus sp. IHB B 3415]
MPDMLLTPGERQNVSSKDSALELRLELANNEAEELNLIRVFHQLGNSLWNTLYLRHRIAAAKLRFSGLHLP